MRIIWSFLKEYIFWLIAAAVVCAMVLHIVSAVQEGKAMRKREAETVARLKTEYRYTVTHHHARRYSYDDVYYSNEVKVDDNKVEFVDCTGLRRTLTGDVTVSENQR